MLRLSGAVNASQTVEQRIVRVRNAHEMGWTNYEIAAMLKIPENTVRAILEIPE